MPLTESQLESVIERVDVDLKGAGTLEVYYRVEEYTPELEVAVQRMDRLRVMRTRALRDARDQDDTELAEKIEDEISESTEQDTNTMVAILLRLIEDWEMYARFDEPTGEWVDKIAVNNDTLKRRGYRTLIAIYRTISEDVAVDPKKSSRSKSGYSRASQSNRNNSQMRILPEIGGQQSRPHDGPTDLTRGNLQSVPTGVTE